MFPFGFALLQKRIDTLIGIIAFHKLFQIKLLHIWEVFRDPLEKLFANCSIGDSQAGRALRQDLLLYPRSGSFPSVLPFA